MTPAHSGFSKESIARIDELVRKVEALPDPAGRALAVELVQAVMTLHAAALARIVQIAPEAVASIAADELVSSVLALHDLHPDSFETRFARVVDKLQRFFDTRGSGMEVLEASPDGVRVRFTGRRPGAGAAAKATIESAIYEAVPEIANLLVEGVEEENGPGFVPLSSLLAAQSA